MRRPMIYVSSMFAAAVIAVHYAGLLTGMALAAVFAALLYSGRSICQNRAMALLLLISYMAGIISYTAHQGRDDPFYGYYGKSTDIVCSVSHVEEEEKRNAWGEETRCLKVTGTLLAVDGRKASAKEKILIRYYSNGDEEASDMDKAATSVVPGQQLKLRGTAELPEGRKNPGCFDYGLYLSSIGIRTIFAAEEISCLSNNSLSYAERIYGKIKRTVYEVKTDFITNLENTAGEASAGLIRGIMFGEKSEMEEEVLEEFRKNGTAHVLAVSGLHVGIIYGFICMVWRWKKGGLFFSVNLMFFFIYMVMSSFSPSVIRAVIMVWLHIFANITARRYDMASAAFFTGLVMMVINPMQIFNAGFQMSFIAVLSLSLMVPIIKRVYSGMLMAGMAIQVGLVPYIAYTFNYISLAALLVNVPVIYLTGLIVPCGMCAMALMYVCEPAFQMTSGVMSGLCTIMTKLNSVTCAEGITVFNVSSPDLWLISVYYLSLLIFVSEDGRLLFIRKKRKTLILLAAVVILTSAVLGHMAGNGFKEADAVFVDVGQGDCIHFRVDVGESYMVDGGGSLGYEVGRKILKPYLLKNGATHLKGAFVTHMHTDHYKGIAELCREGMVERLYVYEGYKVREKEILEDTCMNREDITYLHSGQSIELSDEVCVEILHPEERNRREYEMLASDTEDENSFSLIMKVNIKGRTIMVTGDVDTGCLESLADKYGRGLDCDILKAAHHGSKYSDSDAFTEASSPEYAVFQVGKNNFGHPDKGIIEKYRQKGIIIYRNDKDGAVAFEFTGNGKVKTKTVRGE